MKKIPWLLFLPRAGFRARGLALGLFASAMLVAVNQGHAGKYQPNRAITAKVNTATGADRSTVVGLSKNRKTAYVRSSGKTRHEDGTSTIYVKTRAVRRDTLKITATSANHVGPALEATQRDQVSRDGEGLPPSLMPVHPGDRHAQNVMTGAGHVRTSLALFFHPQRLVLLTKTGAIRGVRAAPDDGVAE